MTDPQYRVRCADGDIIDSFEDAPNVYDGFELVAEARKMALRKSRMADLEYGVWDTREQRFVDVNVVLSA